MADGASEEVAAHCRGIMVERGFWLKWVEIDWDVRGLEKILFWEMGGNLREESGEREEVAELGCLKAEWTAALAVEAEAAISAETSRSLV